MEENYNYLAGLKGIEIDYLSNGSPIYVSKEQYRFSSDSVLLARKVKPNRNDIVVDLCAGNGIIGYEILAKSKFKSLKLVEVNRTQSELSAMTKKHFDNKGTNIDIINALVQDSIKHIPYGSVDIVVSNPPFFKVNSGKMNENEDIAIARHEVKLTLEDLFKVTEKLLHSGGLFYLLHIASRKEEILKLATKYHFELLEIENLDGKLKRDIYVFKDISEKVKRIAKKVK